MPFNALALAVRTHCGEFLCQDAADPARARRIRFHHLLTPATTRVRVPAAGGLAKYCASIESAVFYFDDATGEAARYLAPPAEWHTLHAAFRDELTTPMAEQPDWVASSRVIGEIPDAGDYILVATHGQQGGRVFEFDHRSGEFRHMADDVLDYIERLLAPDARTLGLLTAHMRFSADRAAEQWRVIELHHIDGQVVPVAETATL